MSHVHALHVETGLLNAQDPSGAPLAAGRWAGRFENSAGEHHQACACIPRDHPRDREQPLRKCEHEVQPLPKGRPRSPRIGEQHGQ